MTRPPRRGPAVALMTRAPEPGKTKSRLAEAVGAEAAARLAEAFLLDIAAAVRGAEAWHPALFVEPPDAAPEMAALTGIEDARPQGSGDIGRRMLAVAAALDGDGYTPVVIVGSDIPMLGTRNLHRALSALRRCDVVFGPAEDGGYYLVGAWRARPALFDDPGIEWSGPDVLAASERLARRAGLSTARIAPERDIDRPEDLAWLRDRLAGLELRGEPVPQHTAALLRELAVTGTSGRM